MKDHQDKYCGHKKIRCRVKDCNKEVLRKDMNRHLKENTAAHRKAINSAVSKASTTSPSAVAPARSSTNSVEGAPGPVASAKSAASQACVNENVGLPKSTNSSESRQSLAGPQYSDLAGRKQVKKD